MSILRPRSKVKLGLLLLTPAIHAASTLFEGGTVISFDESSQTPKVLQNTSLLVTDDRIAAIFDSDSLGNVEIPQDTERVSAQGKILSPGFIDTHRHGWQTAYKTIASNTTLSEYNFRYGANSPAESNFTPDDMYFGQIIGMWESLNAGVTTILDHAHGTFSNETSTAYFKGSIDSGARIFWCYGIHDIPNGYTIADQMANFQELAKMPELSNSTVELGIAYDGFSSASSEEVQSVMEFARSSNISALTTHYLGGPWISGNSPQLLNTLNFLNTSFPIIFSHASFLTTQDALLLRQFNQYISTTPESEMHYGHTHPNTPLIQDQAALGIDTHFTYSADMVTQARLWLQSIRYKFFSQVLSNWRISINNPMSVNQAFTLITRSGALSLRRPDLGVLNVGAKADIVVFDGNSPNLLGWSDAVAAIILHSNVGDVEHVMVDGQWRKRDGKLVSKDNVDRNEVNQRFLESARRIQGIWKDMPLPVLEGNQSGVPFAMALMEDVVRGDETGY